MAQTRLNATVNKDRTVTATKQALAGPDLVITFGDAGTNTETVIFNGLTWTVVTSGASGRQFNIGGSAAASATSFAVAFAAHADGAAYTVTDDLAAGVTLELISATATHSNLTGTFNTTAAFGSPSIAAAATLVFDNTLTKYAVNHAMAALMRALHRAFSKVDSPADVPTSGTSTE